MRASSRNVFAIAMAVLVTVHVVVVMQFRSGVTGTVWSLLPAVTAIAMCFITKEVFSSLIYGCLSGAILMMSHVPLAELPFKVLLCLLGGDGNKVGVLDALGSSWNLGILLFVVSTGVVVDLTIRSGGQLAFTKWVKRRVRNRRAALLFAFLLGILCFIDDYFSCLVVGNAMRPVTDVHKVSRAKLAYLVDATASTVCILVPLSSWVAAVSGYIDSDKINGVDLFFKQIPYNFYSLLTLLMIVFISVLNIDFGPMLTHEANAQLKNDKFSSLDRPFEDVEAREVRGKPGSIFDFIIPILVLCLFSLGGILYTGGFFGGLGFLKSFAGSDASRGLAIGGVMTCVFSHFYFRFRQSVSFWDSMQSIPEGAKRMLTPITILILAWVFGGVSREGLHAGEFFIVFVSGFEEYVNFLPAFIFLLACVIAFATGTSWGTIAILAPIAVSIIDYSHNPTICVIALSAVCSGAVCGDHASPISDTSIMASTGAHCSLSEHVVTQLPYVILVVVISFIGFLMTGFVQSQLVCFFMTAVLLMASLWVIKAIVSVRHVGLFEEMAQVNGDLKEDE